MVWPVVAAGLGSNVGVEIGTWVPDAAVGLGVGSDVIDGRAKPGSGGLSGWSISPLKPPETAMGPMTAIESIASRANELAIFAVGHSAKKRFQLFGSNISLISKMLRWLQCKVRAAVNLWRERPKC
jgi:hypothetical protein